VRRPSPSPGATTVVPGAEEKSELRQLGGSHSDLFNRTLLNALARTLWLQRISPRKTEQRNARLR
jgi:hypothetical protein